MLLVLTLRMCLLVGSVRSMYSVFGVSTNTGTGLPTTMDTIGTAESMGTFASSGSTVFGYATATSQITLTLFDSNANRVFQMVASSTFSVATDLALTSDMTVLLIANYQKALILTLSQSGSLFSVATSMTVSDGHQHRAVTVSNTDGYLYTGYYRVERKVSKANIQNQHILYSVDVSTYSDDFCNDLLWLDNNVVLPSATKYLIVLLDSTDINSITKVYTVPQPISRSVMDNLDPSILFAFFCDANSANLRAYDLSSQGNPSPSEAFNPLILNTDFKESAILNFGPYHYFGLAATESSIFSVVSKSNFSVVAELSLMTNIQRFSLIGALANLPDKYHFGVSSIHAGNNFQSYYLLFDRCLRRDNDGVCEECYENNYRLDVVVNNQCISENQIPNHYGNDSGSRVLQVLPCSSPGCQVCLIHYSQCQICDAAGGYFLNASDSTCIHITNIPQRFGVNLNSGTIVGCSDGDCLLCKADHQNCSLCDEGSGQYVNPESLGCLAVPEIPAGKGVDSVSKSILPCSTGNCADCALDYSNCLVCNTSGGYYMDPTTLQCSHVDAIPAGFGIDLATFQIVPCLDTECTSCKSNNSMCLGCNTGQNYYLDPGSASCLPLDQISDTFGVNLATGQISSCLVPDCKNCQNDHTICNQCLSENGFYQNASSGLCLNETNTPSGWGPDLTTLQLKPCQTENCTLCSTNYLTCSKCNVQNGSYLNETTLQCISISQIPNGFGLNQSGNILPCLEDNCSLCTVNYSKCMACFTDNQFYYDPLQEKCVLISQINSGFGINNSTGQIIPCLSTGCSNCQTDFQQCQTCNTGQNYYLDQTSSLCIQDVNIPAGVGVDHDTGLLRTCKEAFCIDCANDYTECQQCTASKGYSLDGTGKCILQNITDQNGTDPFINQTKPCDSPGCLECPLNHKVCQRCDTSSGYCLNRADSRCLTQEQTPDNYGCQANTGVIVGCSDQGCMQCRANHSRCTICDPTRDFYMNDGQCKSLDQAAPGFGLESNLSGLGPCYSKGCINCKRNTAICLECDQANGYTLKAGNCIIPSAEILIKKANYKVQDQKAEIRFNQEVTLDSSLLKAYIEDEPEANIDIEIKSQAEGFDLIINKCSKIGTVTIIIDKKQSGSAENNVKYAVEGQSSSKSHFPIASSSNPSVPFSGYPIKVLNAKIFDKETYSGAQAVASSTIQTANNLRTVTSVILISTPSLAVLLDKLFCDLIYMQLLGSQNQTYPSTLFELAGEASLSPIDVGDLFKSVTDEDCEPDFAFKVNGFDCSFMGNYGDDVLALAFFFVVSLLFEGILFLFRRKVPGINKKTKFEQKWKNWVFRAAHNFGLSFFYLKIDGNIFEIIIYSFNGLRNAHRSSNTKALATTVVLSLASIIYTAVYYFSLWQCTKSVIALRTMRDFCTPENSVVGSVQSKVSATSKTDPFENPREFQEVINLVNSRHPRIAFSFDGIRYPIRDAHLYYPLILLWKPTILAACVVFLSNTGSIQIMVLLIVEVSYYVYTLKANVKASKSETLVENLNNFLIIMFLCFAGLSYTSLAEQDPNSFVGICMALLIILTVLVDLVFIGYTVATAIIELCQRKCCKKRKTKEYKMSSKPGDKSPSKYRGEITRVTLGKQTPVLGSKMRNVRQMQVYDHLQSGASYRNEGGKYDASIPSRIIGPSNKSIHIPLNLEPETTDLDLTPVKSLFEKSGINPGENTSKFSGSNNQLTQFQPETTLELDSELVPLPSSLHQLALSGANRLTHSEGTNPNEPREVFGLSSPSHSRRRGLDEGTAEIFEPLRDNRTEAYIHHDARDNQADFEADIDERQVGVQVKEQTGPRFQ